MARGIAPSGHECFEDAGDRIFRYEVALRLHLAARGGASSGCECFEDGGDRVFRYEVALRLHLAALGVASSGCECFEDEGGPVFREALARYIRARAPARYIRFYLSLFVLPILLLYKLI